MTSATRMARASLTIIISMGESPAQHPGLRLSAICLVLMKAALVLEEGILADSIKQIDSGILPRLLGASLGLLGMANRGPLLMS